MVKGKAAGYRVAMWLPMALRRWLPAALLLAALGCGVVMVQTSPPFTSGDPAGVAAAPALSRAAAHPSGIRDLSPPALPAITAVQIATGVSTPGVDCGEDGHFAVPPDMSASRTAAVAVFAPLPVCPTPPQAAAALATDPRGGSPSALGLLLAELAVRRT